MKRFFARVYRWLKTVIGSFLEHNCSMHAAGLTYFSLLALVPMLCLLLFTAKTCGVDRYARTQINAKIDAMIANIESGQDDVIVAKLSSVSAVSAEEREKKRIAALEFGRQARSISNILFDRIDRFDIGTLGWIGFFFLLWTVISSLGMAETSFNEIWGVEKPRPIWQRACLYLFVSIVLPVLAAIAMSLPVLGAVKQLIVATLGATYLTRWAGDGLIWVLESCVFRLVFSLVFAALACGFFLWIMPKCKVRVRPALYGGLLTAALFGGWLKLCAIAQVGIAKSSALYGSFAFLPIILAWMYMSWQIVLIGACFTHAFQVAGDER